LLKDKTVIVIAHRLSTIQHSNQILVIDGGQVVEAGNQEELIAKDGLYKKMWDMHTASGDWAIGDEKLVEIKSVKGEKAC